MRKFLTILLKSAALCAHSAFETFLFVFTCFVSQSCRQRASRANSSKNLISSSARRSATTASALANTENLSNMRRLIRTTSDGISRRSIRPSLSSLWRQKSQQKSKLLPTIMQIYLCLFSEKTVAESRKPLHSARESSSAVDERHEQRAAA